MFVCFFTLNNIVETILKCWLQPKLKQLESTCPVWKKYYCQSDYISGIEIAYIVFTC